MESKFALQIDSATVDAAREGCAASCEQIYRLFQRPVYTTAVRILSCREDAQEVLQETFIKALSNLHRYRGEAPFWAWLRQIAVNTALSALRKRGRRDGEMSLSDLFEHQIPGGRCTNAHAVDLTEAIARLPARTRAVLWLHDVEGYTHKEIGALMGRTTSFSKSQVARGHAALRQMLNPDTDLELCGQPS